MTTPKIASTKCNDQCKLIKDHDEWWCAMHGTYYEPPKEVPERPRREGANIRGIKI